MVEMDDPDPKLAVLPPDTTTPSSDSADLPELEVCVISRFDRWEITEEIEAQIGRLVRCALCASGNKPEGFLEINIVLASSEEVARLNEEFRGKEGATNVLSFPVKGDGPVICGNALPLGDVVLALEVVQQEARELGIELNHHLYHLTVHGVLHLLGYDHEEESEATLMEQLETKILLSEGFHDPYLDDRGSGGRSKYVRAGE